MNAPLALRRATIDDVPAIIALLADDELGRRREMPDDRDPYDASFAAIDADPHQLLVVGESNGDIVATMQLTFIPGMSRRGTWRAQIEGVRVASSARGAGIGERLIRWAVEQARDRGCALVQLTSDASRTGAHRFYARLGFVASHTGFKLDLSPADREVRMS
ncbi:GNAT family N-acetyltransferase [Phytoactinopolyspora halotolerans]|nr:GNAT family N-acetyltransferase [Phytoactinopolyspora halotolerans]